MTEELEGAILYEKLNGIATITLNQPETLNVLTYDMVGHFQGITKDLRRDRNVRAGVLLRGQPTGRNRADARPRRHGSARGGDGNERSSGRLRRDGKAVAGGRQWPGGWRWVQLGPGLRPGADRRVGLSVSSLGYVNIGMVLDMGSTFLLSRLVGLRKANELAFFGDRIHGPEAAEIGLANRAVPDGDLMDRSLATGPTLSIGAIILGMRRALDGTFRDALHWEAMMISLIAQTGDATEGLTAFFQKRKPEFAGR